MEDKDILKMYDLVFEDAVQCRIEDMNYDLEENEPIKTLTDAEKQIIVHNLIYKSDYMWEIINETIDWEIQNAINKRGK